MDQTRSNIVKNTNASSSSSPRNKYENIADEEFKKHLLVGKDKTLFELVYFILNTLHLFVILATGIVIVKIVEVNAECGRYQKFLLIL